MRYKWTRIFRKISINFSVTEQDDRFFLDISKNAFMDKVKKKYTHYRLMKV